MPCDFLRPWKPHGNFPEQAWVRSINVVGELGEWGLVLEVDSGRGARVGGRKSSKTFAAKSNCSTA